MILRRCAGGIVFYANKVLIVKNDKGEWTIPKGKISDSDIPSEVAPLKVKEEVAVDAKVLDMAGDTIYEFYSRTRQQKVCNAIVWYIMESDNTQYNVNDESIIEAGFFKVKDALDMLTHNREKSLVDISYRKFKDLKKQGIDN
ncbi:MAG: NUDIX domain-containing protein [Paraclostridium sp.]|uniref:NUDIX domain-containing protein n=1 Tax=Paraclostridium sp. TaxID=2023273 RepID=UPI003F3957E8